MLDTNYNLYPELDFFDQKILETGDLHEIYYEICGNPLGEPVVFLHGGPGSGCNPTQRRFFDPAHYKIILIDQRGCGRSTPQGAITHNTTAHLVADIEEIREALNIKQWHVFGGSWGSTLALAYALAFPQQVTSLVLRGIFLSRPSELNWFLGDVAHFHPEACYALTSYVAAEERQDVLSAYSKLIFNDDCAVNVPAAQQWNAFENAMMRLVPSQTIQASPVQQPTKEQEAVDVARARVQIHYIAHGCFVDGEAMLNDCAKLAGIPTIIVQGRYDMVCPPKSAWELSRAMPHAEFHMIPDAGHSAMELGITSALIAATEKFKGFQSKK